MFRLKTSMKFDTTTVAGPFQLSRSQGATYWGGDDGEAFKAVSRLRVIDGLNNITLNGANTQAGFNCAPPLCHSHLIRLAASSSFHKLWPAAEQHYKASLSNIPSKSAIKSYGTRVEVNSPSRGRSHQTGKKLWFLFSRWHIKIERMCKDKKELVLWLLKIKYNTSY